MCMITAEALKLKATGRNKETLRLSHITPGNRLNPDDEIPKVPSQTQLYSSVLALLLNRVITLSLGKMTINPQQTLEVPASRVVCIHHEWIVNFHTPPHSVFPLPPLLVRPAYLIRKQTFSGGGEK